MSKAHERCKNWTGVCENFKASLLQRAWVLVCDILVLWVMNGVCVFSMSKLCSVAIPGSGAGAGEMSVCVCECERKGRERCVFPIRIYRINFFVCFVCFIFPSLTLKMVLISVNDLIFLFSYFLFNQTKKLITISEIL